MSLRTIVKPILNIVTIAAVTVVLVSCGNPPPPKGDSEEWTGAITALSPQHSKKIKFFIDGREVLNDWGEASLTNTHTFESNTLDYRLTKEELINGFGITTWCPTEQKFEIRSNSGKASNRKNIDAVLDLTYFAGDSSDTTANPLNAETKSRVDKFYSLLDWNLIPGVSMRDGDTLALRFIGTMDYGIGKKNIPITDKVVINLTDTSRKALSMRLGSCKVNKRKGEIYVYIKSADIKIETVAIEYAFTQSGWSWSIIRKQAANRNELRKIVEHEFKSRFESWIYSKGSYIPEFLDQTDIMEDPSSSTKTFIFSDGEFQLHPNFKRHFSNPLGKNLDKWWDFSPDIFNIDSLEFQNTYDSIAKDGYYSSLKNKCEKSKSVTFIGAKSRTNKYFEEYMKSFYWKLLPKCSISFK